MKRISEYSAVKEEEIDGYIIDKRNDQWFVFCVSKSGNEYFESKHDCERQAIGRLNQIHKSQRAKALKQFLDITLCSVANIFESKQALLRYEYDEELSRDQHLTATQIRDVLKEYQGLCGEYKAVCEWGQDLINPNEH